DAHGLAEAELPADGHVPERLVERRALAVVVVEGVPHQREGERDVPEPLRDADAEVEREPVVLGAERGERGAEAVDGGGGAEEGLGHAVVDAEVGRERLRVGVVERSEERRVGKGGRYGGWRR